MNYATGRAIKIGDRVLADGMAGVVVCDFDHREFLDGHAGWDMPEAEMIGGGKLNSGVMIDTVEAGLVHYPEMTEGIVFIDS
ncbi:hypothetical protein [Novosphingobium aquimarinum]|uniref:hypothetical protein n=1 Tax=Novosphingobium aquimarinum TaxID=2682494 RepID=UPI0012EC604A|nr:hypothetical protein [Novosphingobium aquimarinum]